LILNRRRRILSPEDKNSHMPVGYWLRMRYCIFIAVVATLACSACHDPRRGQSSANETPVADGRVILLRRNNEFAAVILKNQRMSPELTDFTWYYRSDLRGTFAPGDKAVSTGFVTNVGTIAFATFSVQWSMCSYGSGWVYFSESPAELRKPADYLMCVTSETNVTAIDATDKKWKYRARPGVNLHALVESQVKK
jgi:hypothetical protein